MTTWKWPNGEHMQ